jgi:hypothetical protein
VRIALALTVALLVAGETGCGWECNLAGCPGGFSLRILGSDPQVGLPSGRIVLRAVVEDGEFVTVCVVAQSGDVSCEHGDWRIEPSTTIAGLVSASNDTEAGGEVQLFFVVMKDAKNGMHHLGPEHVSLTIELDDVEIFDGSWEPMYERIRDFNGAGCGDCDRLVDEAATLPNSL